jgi:hypothetical protein
MVNKTKISSQISSARRNLIDSILINSHLPDLGFDAKLFPPEKTIFLSLLRETGIHRPIEQIYSLAAPEDKSFEVLWNECNNFIESTKNGKRNLQEFADILMNKPFKMKKGFVDFWLPLFLIIKKGIK